MGAFGIAMPIADWLDCQSPDLTFGSQNWKQIANGML
jgi:hypothetical protein